MFRDLTQPGGNFASSPSPPLCPYIRKRMISLHRFFNFIKTCECVLPPASIPLRLQIKFLASKPDFIEAGTVKNKLIAPSSVFFTWSLRLQIDFSILQPYFRCGLYGQKYIFLYLNRIPIQFTTVTNPFSIIRTVLELALLLIKKRNSHL